LRGRGTGLGEVLAAAGRRVSLDQALRNVARNPLEQMVRDHPQLRAIAFNGAAAAANGRRLLADVEGLALTDLPSSSPANTRPFAGKLAAWARLAPYCTSPPA